MPRRTGEVLSASRRSFLKLSAVGSVGVLSQRHLVNVHANVQAAAPAPGIPEDIVSPADSLILLIDLLTSIQFEAYRSAGARLSKATKECSDALMSLTGSVQDLEDELRKSKVKDSADKVKVIKNLGRSSTDLLKSARLPATTSSQVNFAAITENMCDAIEELLPKKQFNPTPGVTKALADVLCKARELRPVSDKTRTAQTQYLTEVGAVNNEVSKAEQEMISACLMVTRVFNALTPAAALKHLQASIEHIAGAIATLEKLKLKNPDTAKKELPTLQVLIDGLQGTQNWVKEILGAKTAGRDRVSAGDDGEANNKVRIVKASFGAGSNNPAAAAAAAVACALSAWNMRHHIPAVLGLLEEHCKPSTYARAIMCIAYAKPAWEKYCGNEENKGRIETMGKMRLLPCWAKGGNKKDLIKALADYDLRK